MSAGFDWISSIYWLRMLLDLGLLFVFLVIWQKTAIRGFGVLALAKGLGLISHYSGRFLYQFGFDSALVFTLISFAVEVVFLVGVLMLYTHYRRLWTRQTAKAAGKD